MQRYKLAKEKDVNKANIIQIKHKPRIQGGFDLTPQQIIIMVKKTHTLQILKADEVL